MSFGPPGQMQGLAPVVLLVELMQLQCFTSWTEVWDLTLVWKNAPACSSRKRTRLHSLLVMHHQRSSSTRSSNNNLSMPTGWPERLLVEDACQVSQVSRVVLSKFPTYYAFESSASLRHACKRLCMYEAIRMLMDLQTSSCSAIVNTWIIESA